MPLLVSLPVPFWLLLFVPDPDEVLELFVAPVLVPLFVVFDVFPPVDVLEFDPVLLPV